MAQCNKRFGQSPKQQSVKNVPKGVFQIIVCIYMHRLIKELFFGFFPNHLLAKFHFEMKHAQMITSQTKTKTNKNSRPVESLCDCYQKRLNIF